MTNNKLQHFLSSDLGPDELRTVRSELFSVRDKWYDIGLELNIPFQTLNVIEKDNPNNCANCLRKMLMEWLSSSSPDPSWSGLVEALSSEPVREKRLAREIHSKYCAASDSINGGEMNACVAAASAGEQGMHISTETVLAKSRASGMYMCMCLNNVFSVVIYIYVLFTAGSQATETNLKSQIDSLQKEFVKLRDDVYESVKSQPVGTFKVKLLSLDANTQQHHETALKEIICDKETVDDIWIELGSYMNFLNYELLLHVLGKFKNAHLLRRMNEYADKMRKFFKTTRLCTFLNCWPVRGNTPPEEELRNFLTAKTTKDWNTCTLEELDNTRESLARKLLLPKFALILENASRGCVSITFSIPPSLVAQLQEDIKNTELKVFVEMDIETIIVDGVVCYEAPLLQYTTHLKQLYTSRSPLQPLSDSTHKHLLHFRLARIEKQTLSQEDMDRFTRESLRGDMDDVVYKKMAMESSELGVMADGSQPKVVLIEGAPGVGKTTFAWQQCRQWAEGKLLQAYRIVLLLPLRDNNIRHITSLPDLFQHSKEQVRDEVTRRVVESNGSGCLIWLEAWDELVEDLRSDSLFTQLIRGLQLPAATIYITSRPWATGGVLEQMEDRTSQHTELLALAKEEVESQMRAIAVSEGTGRPSPFDFMTYIDSNPVMHAAMYTPVTAAIVGQVFKCTPHNLPATVTQLYSAYVLMRLEHYLTQHPKYSDRNMKVRTLGDLPEGVLAEFWRLCALAYEGVSQQMIVFSRLPESVSTLGLLQSVPQLYGEEEDQVSYNFLHYTVQEYLAALHLSHLPPQEQMTIIDTKCLRMAKTKYGRSYYETTQFKTTFQFLAGITKLESYPVDFLSELLSEGEVTMYSWLYESQNLPLLTSVLGSSERELRMPYSATTTEYFVAGYCLTHSHCTWSIIYDCISVNDMAMEFLKKGCNRQLPETVISTRILKASFDHGSITADGVRHFLTFPNPLLQHIQHLDLSCNKLDRRACEVLAEGVQRMPCLKTLNMPDNSVIGCGGAVQLVSCLHSTKLRELDLSRTGISDPDFECLASYIHSTTSLQGLRIGWNDISVESIDSLCKALSGNSSMRTLDMSGCHLTTSHCVCLGQLLGHPIHCKIEELNLIHCSLTSGVEVVSGLNDNHTLRVLYMSDNQITSEGAVAIAAMLKRNSSLERLDLGLCSIVSSGGVELGAALERNKTLRVLGLSDNALGDDGVRGLCVGLENNSSLEELYLHGDESLGEEGVLIMLKCLEKENRNLKELWLPRKYKRDIPSALQSRCDVVWM